MMSGSSHFNYDGWKVANSKNKLPKISIGLTTDRSLIPRHNKYFFEKKLKRYCRIEKLYLPLYRNIERMISANFKLKLLIWLNIILKYIEFFNILKWN
jgi:hypothetical protein